MKVVVDRQRCTGHGRCYATAPDVFEPDERGHGVAVVEVVPPEHTDQARNAQANCPEGAITLVG